MADMAVKTTGIVPDTEKLANAKKFKEEGNECHKCKQYKRAVGKYHRALLQLKGIGSAKSSGLGSLLSDKDMEELGYGGNVPEEVRHEVTKLTADCYNNLAACLLQLPEPNYEKIIDYCNNVIELTPSNVKAYYRRGMAYCHLENFEKALESFDQAESEAGSNIEQGLKALLNKQVQVCKAGIHRQEQKLKEAYKGMFNRKQDIQSSTENPSTSEGEMKEDCDSKG